MQQLKHCHAPNKQNSIFSGIQMAHLRTMNFNISIARRKTNVSLYSEYPCKLLILKSA